MNESANESVERPEPNWGLLPRDPVGFFALAPDFDRTGLKRAYNALIRRFKPEQHPEEFQRIRTAFEELDQRLRYGNVFEHATAFSTPGDSFASTTTNLRPQGQQQKPSQSAREDLAELLRNESPQLLFEHLRSRPQKSPFVFYALAILSDVVTPDEPLAFLNWLLQGLAEFRDEPTLSRVLFAFLRTSLPTESLPEVMRAVAQTVNNDRFYYLTEPLWERLLAANSADASRVTLLLDDCEKLIRDHRTFGKVTFYIRFLRRAVWVADEGWLAGAFAFVHGHAMELGGRFDFDLGLLELLEDYRATRRQFLNRSEARRRIDAAMRDYCLLNEYAADKAVLECQLKLATRPEMIREAFNSSTANENSNSWFPLWNGISMDVADRLADHSDRIEVQRMWDQLRIVLQRAEQVTSSSIIGHAWGAANIGLLGLLLLIVGAMTAIISGIAIVLLSVLGTTFTSREPSLAVLVIAASLMLSIVVYAMFLHQRSYAPLQARTANSMSARCYRRLWRPLLERHLSLTHQPFQLLLEHLDYAQQHVAGFSISWIARYASQDYGLACLAISKRFLR
jgi:hypothetical protein